ncbi:MAG TPA: hypothetical protein VH092_05945 [Urbifossiella sp.]|jgi:Leucine-rich repeat (LRR) protein|nr:hypothetical protein [Urbifossiella sp.]
MFRTRVVLVVLSVISATMVVACGVKINTGPKADEGGIVAVPPGQGPGNAVPGADPVEAKLQRLNGKVKRSGDRPTGAVVEVRLFNQNITDADLAELATLSDLRKLDLTGVKVTGTGLAALSAIPLEELDLAFSGVTNEGLKEVAKFTSLKALGLMNASKITDEGVGDLAALKNMESLTIGQSPKVKDVGTGRALRGMPHLQRLDITNSAVGDGAMKALTECPDLRALRFYGSQVTDTGMGSIGKLTKLEELHLNFHITDKGLDRITGLTNLKTFSLYYTSRITYGGLKKMPWLTGLTDLNLYGASIPAEKLREELPNCNIKP